MRSISSIFTFLIFISLSATSYASSSEEVKALLAQDKAPSGVVFEIVTGAANSLEWALPRTQKYIKQLRQRFPKLDVAIVTHGNEQFALQTNNDEKYKKVHSLTQQLTQSEDVPLHVCGTYASWRNITEEDFPDYVDVASAGPATINDYIALGYVLIKI